MGSSAVASAGVLALCGLVLVAAGSRLARSADRLADRTGMGEAIAGAVLLGATTSLPGLITTGVGAASGDGGFAVGNALGGIAVQTAFLPLADLRYRRANLEHAAASLPNLLQAVVLVFLLGLILLAVSGPEVDLAGVHPLSVVLVLCYAFSLRLVRQAHGDPAWAPEETDETRSDEPDEDQVDLPLARLWGEFAVLAAVVAVTGFAVARAGLALIEATGASGTVVGALGTGVVTSLPELVTLLAAVRIGALTLAVGDILGGNVFDVLMIPVADAAYRSGSVYHAVGPETVFVLALSLALTSLIAAGLVHRQRRGIGFEGVGTLVLYLGGMAVLVTAF